MKPNGGGKIPGELEKALKDLRLDRQGQGRLHPGRRHPVRLGLGLAAVKDGKISVMKTPNGESPLVHGGKPILGVDVWEHSYYIDFRNRRPDYLKAFVDTWSIGSMSPKCTARSKRCRALRRRAGGGPRVQSVRFSVFWMQTSTPNASIDRPSLKVPCKSTRQLKGRGS